MGQKVIEVSRKNVRCDDDQVLDYVKLVNGIVIHCEDPRYGYTEGWRNEIAVDLTVASWMLGLDPKDVILQFDHAGTINKFKDDEDPYERVRRVLGYVDSFDWDWMLNPEHYTSLYDKGEKSLEKTSIVFKLV